MTINPKKRAIIVISNKKLNCKDLFIRLLLKPKNKQYQNTRAKLNPKNTSPFDQSPVVCPR